MPALISLSQRATCVTFKSKILRLESSWTVDEYAENWIDTSVEFPVLKLFTNANDTYYLFLCEDLLVCIGPCLLSFNQIQDGGNSSQQTVVIFVMCSAFQQVYDGVSACAGNIENTPGTTHIQLQMFSNVQQVSDRWGWPLIVITTTMPSNSGSEHWTDGYSNSIQFKLYINMRVLFQIGEPIFFLRKTKAHTPHRRRSHTINSIVEEKYVWTWIFWCRLSVCTKQVNTTLKSFFPFFQFTYWQFVHGVNFCHHSSVCKIERNLLDFCGCASGSHSVLNSVNEPFDGAETLAACRWQNKCALLWLLFLNANKINYLRMKDQKNSFSARSHQHTPHGYLQFSFVNTCVATAKWMKGNAALLPRKTCTFKVFT